MKTLIDLAAIITIRNELRRLRKHFEAVNKEHLNGNFLTIAESDSFKPITYAETLLGKLALANIEELEDVLSKHEGQE